MNLLSVIRGMQDVYAISRCPCERLGKGGSRFFGSRVDFLLRAILSEGAGDHVRGNGD